MTTTNVLSELGNKWLPFTAEQYFTAQRAPDMWFGDELPPTLQAEMLSPLVLQAKMMLARHILTALEQGQRRKIAEHQARRFAAAKSRVGKRVKTSRR